MKLYMASWMLAISLQMLPAIRGEGFLYRSKPALKPTVMGKILEKGAASRRHD